MKVLISEERLYGLISECVKRILSESKVITEGSSLLYHFLNFDRFKSVVETNMFTPTSFEKGWFGGKNSISLSRTKNFREGWPVIMYSGDDGKGDDWCAIRLTIDGDLINRKPNFKYNGKQYNMSTKAFDWAYKEFGDGDPYDFSDNTGVFANNGKEWMERSDGYTTSYLPIDYNGDDEYYNGVCDKQGHPYSQAEDRLTTYADKIPNANQYILSVDIVLLPHNFNDDNMNERIELCKICENSFLKGKIHIYRSERDLMLGRWREIRNIRGFLLDDSYYENPIPFYDNVKRDF